MTSPPEHPPCSFGRRTFLERGWGVIRLAIAAALVYPLLRFLGFHAPRQPRLVRIHKEPPAGGFVVEHDFILFVGEKGPWAVSRRCTHLGCRLNYKEKEQLLLCPCHQSRFSTAGKRLGGPARKDLPTFKVARMAASEGKGYVVTL
ncbi:MAG: ubiquinol-cytochrome c reductase iron-sulfur subunit [Thermodesulfobacteriota bacterium]